MTNPKSGINDLLDSLKYDRLIGSGVFNGIQDRKNKKDESEHFYTLFVGKLNSQMEIKLNREQFLQIKAKETNGELTEDHYIQYTCRVTVKTTAREWASADGRSGAMVDSNLSQPELIDYKL